MIPPRSRAFAAISFAFLVLAVGCQRPSSSQGSAPPQQGGYGYGYGPGPGQQPYPPPQGAPYGAPPPGAPPGAPPQPGQPPGPGPAAPGFPPQAPPSFPSVNDPINAVDLNYLRNEAGQVMGELIAALPAAAKAKVQNIPFIADPTPGEVNAFAGCDDQGQPFMAITDGLLEISAYIAQFRATDEIFGTRKVDGYVQLVAKNQRPKQPIVRPAPGMVDPMQHVDGRKVARQHDVYDEMMAFVLGHELGHHHLGHTGCANGGGSRGITPADLGRVLSRTVPMFNQPNEIAADIAGTNNLLTAGSRRQGYRWTEGGAILTLNFFAQLDQLTPASIVFAFENSHPHPLIRIPIVQQTASTWRMTGGAPPFGGIFGG